MQVEIFCADLLAWYDHAAADLPWRRTRDPYHVWLSEIMLQQTQVSTVIPYFQRFLAAFPTINALAAATTDAVLKHWEGLGYYSRARNLHRAAQKLVAVHGGRLPTTSAALQTLPGIGRYTANAIASIAFDERVAVLDGNVIRVLARLYDLTEDVTLPATQRHLWNLAESLLPAGRPGDYNQAMMELGREICKPRKPLCTQCPVSAHCLAFLRSTQAERPLKTRKTTMPHYDVAAGIIWADDGRFLIAQRPADGLLGGLWEFPAVRRSGAEPLVDLLVRALREKLNIEAEIGEQMLVVRHAFTHFKMTLHVFECHYRSGIPELYGYAAWRWVSLDETDQFAFARADRKVIDYLQSRPLRLI